MMNLHKSRKPRKMAGALTYSYGRHAESEFLLELEGKRVVIVGAAGYMEGGQLGEEIDSYDVVVRVNHALPITLPEDHGSRCDVLYHLLSRRGSDGTVKYPIDKEEILSWKGEGVKWVVSRQDFLSRRVRELQTTLADGVPWICIRKRFSDEVKAGVRRHPNTGLIAIAHLLKSRLKELQVYGFDFYASGVYTGYGDVREGETAIDVNAKHHDIVSQVAYVKILAKRDNRLKVDEHFQAILDKCTCEQKTYSGGFRNLG